MSEIIFLIILLISSLFVIRVLVFFRDSKPKYYIAQKEAQGAVEQQKISIRRGPRRFTLRSQPRGMQDSVEETSGYEQYIVDFTGADKYDMIDNIEKLFKELKGAETSVAYMIFWKGSI